MEKKRFLIRGPFTSAVELDPLTGIKEHNSHVTIPPPRWHQKIRLIECSRIMKAPLKPQRSSKHNLIILVLLNTESKTFWNSKKGEQKLAVDYFSPQQKRVGKQPCIFRPNFSSAFIFFHFRSIRRSLKSQIYRYSYNSD